MTDPYLVTRTTTIPILKAVCHGDHELGQQYFQPARIKWWSGGKSVPAGWYCFKHHSDWPDWKPAISASTWWNLSLSRTVIEVPSPHYGCDVFHIHLYDCNECSDHKAAGCAGCFAWAEFCRKHGMSPLADATWSRRAWIPGLSSYLRGCNYLIFDDDELVDIK